MEYGLKCIAEMCLEEGIYQNVDTGLRFCFMVYRKREFKKNSPKLQKVTHKISYLSLYIASI